LVGGSRGGENRCLKAVRIDIQGSLAVDLQGSKALTEVRVRDCPKTYLFPGVFAPILSLDELLTTSDGDAGGIKFDLIDPGPLADEQIEHTETTAAVNDFVASLAPRDQEIVRRVFWGGESQAEVAARFSVSKMAISKTIARIYRKGRTALAKYENLHTTDSVVPQLPRSSC